MKYTIATAAVITIASVLPLSAHANEPVSSPPPVQQQSMNNAPCPTMANMDAMHKMMDDMSSMMQMMSDPVMKERMQKMHENMGIMMQQMMDMQKGMGGMMMQGGNAGGQKTESVPAVTPPETKDPHHPDKQ